MAACIAGGEWEYSEEELKGIVYDIVRDIKDPEKPETLEELAVVYEEGISIRPLENNSNVIHVEFTPTVSHCNLATLIGLCIRVKLQKELPMKHKLDITIKEGTHDSRDEVTKQINDKERVAAAMENPNLRILVNQCIEPQDL